MTSATDTPDALAKARRNHDAIARATTSRDDAIVELLKGGMSAEDIARGMNGRLTAAWIRKLGRDAGVKAPGRPGRRPLRPAAS